MATRRQALSIFGASLISSGWSGLGQASPQPISSFTLLSSFTTNRGAHVLQIFDPIKGDGRTHPLPGRGHGACLSPDGGTAVLFARRPDCFAIVVGVKDSSVSMRLNSAAGRHFYGHGFFSPDGKILYAVENDYDNARGVIGLYDASDRYRRLGEVETFGIGPHEAILLSDGETIAVANGGIETHPDYPREKLNLTTMAPSLVLIRRSDGALLGKYSLPHTHHQVSLRHICEAGDGSLWVAGQYQGPLDDPIEVLAVHRPNAPLHLVDSLKISKTAKRYIGSIQASIDGQQIALTAPRGGVAVIYDVRTHAQITVHKLPDVCGITALREGFLFSNGQGNLWLDGKSIGPTMEGHWDNHMIAIPG